MPFKRTDSPLMQAHAVTVLLSASLLTGLGAAPMAMAADLNRLNEQTASLRQASQDTVDRARRLGRHRDARPRDLLLPGHAGAGGTIGGPRAPGLSRLSEFCSVGIRLTLSRRACAVLACLGQ